MSRFPDSGPILRVKDFFTDHDTIFSPKTQSLDYQAAQLYCRNLRPTKRGVDLLTLESRIEESHLDTMLQFIKFGNVTSFIHKKLWLGLDSLGKHEDRKSWSSHAPIFYLNWAAGQPSNINGTERCTVMEDAAWYDTHCGDLNRFICEIDTTALSAMSGISSDYKPQGWCPEGTFHFRDDCYAVYADRERQLTFKEARDYCRTVDGRDLASFESIEALNYLLSNGS